MKLYRAMKAATDGLPEVGPSARALGVRPADRAPNNDVPAADPTDTVSPGHGMSVAPHDPANLPVLRRPVALGGRGTDTVWELDVADLGPDLRFNQDATAHGLIEPARDMALAEYQAALAATRDRWRSHLPGR